MSNDPTPIVPEPNPEPETPPATPDPLDDPEPDDGQTFDAAYVRSLRSEAASRRQEARDATERVETLSAEVATLRTAAEDRTVQDIAADRMQDPSILPRLVDLDELRDDDGQLDRDRLTAAINDLTTRMPYLRPASPDFKPGARPPATATPSAGEALARVMGGG